MTAADDEDALLRSVALQNATSILVARQRAEQRNAAYLAEAQRLSRTGSFGWKPGRNEIRWSDETFRIFQYDRTTQPTVERILKRVHAADVGRIQEDVARAAKEETGFDHEYRLLMPDGTVTYVHVVARPMRAGTDDVEFVGAVMDVTEQHHARAALETALEEMKKSEDRFRLVIDTIPGMVWSGLPDGVFDFVNQPWLTYLGLTWEELAAQGGLSSVVHPDDIEASHEQWRVTRTTERHTDHELRMRRADGAYRWFLTRALPLRDERGTVVRWYGTATDIDDRKRAEEDQRRAADALHQAQADLAHVSRVTTMGELAASLAHEVNQPIAASLMNANACLRWLAADTPNLEEARAAASRIVSDATRAGEIVSRIRRFFEKGALPWEPVHLNEVIQEMVVLLRTETTRYRILVRTALAADLPPVMGDRVQLQQVVMNLMMNGVEAMKDTDGSRELVLKSERTNGDQLLVSVRDTGVGLPPQENRIFDAFFTTKRHGTGMGLSISRSIIESHGGRLSAGHNSPRGASFYVMLPAGSPTVNSAAASASG